jgi:DNA-binding HxlR family transcriptional regulator
VSHPKRKSEGGVPAGRANQYAYAGLDRVIHERARLSVLTSLARYPKGLRFNDLKALCGLTDGNLSRHMQVLQEAGLVEVFKTFEQSRPQTTCHLTADGHKRYVDYLAVLEQVVRDAAAAVKEGRGRVANLKQ